MNVTWNREERAKQKQFLARYFADYDARRHDAFVARFNAEQERIALENYQVRRGIIPARER